MRTSKCAICICFLCSASYFACAQVQGPVSNTPSDESCRAFVQQFYDWYVPNAFKRTKQSAWIIALRKKPEYFSRELSWALTKEDEIDAETQDAGIDADPFLMAQDSGGRYKVGKIRVSEGHCSADVNLIYSGPKLKQPQVIAELTWAEEHWVFVNFRYENIDLLKMLKGFREGYEKYKKIHGGKSTKP